jgi:uncharacterized protein (TIGR00369 family)
MFILTLIYAFVSPYCMRWQPEREQIVDTKARPARMNVDEVRAFLRREFPQMFRGPTITIERADGRGCRLLQVIDENMLRPGGLVSGATLMALADVAMYVALLAAIGPAALAAVTTSFNANFLSKVPPGSDLIAEAKLLKLGNRLAVGEVAMFSSGSSDPVAHMTLTYSIPPQ